CLQWRYLACGGKMDTRNYQYGVETYNPQIFSRQLGCPQGQVCRFCTGSDLKLHQPGCCCIESFQSW
ncbi:unnamed protein product, partial [Prunus brigantina]